MSDRDRQLANLMNALADSLDSLSDKEVLEESQGESAEDTRRVLLGAMNRWRVKQATVREKVLLELLENMVCQHCTHPDGTLWDGALSDNEEALHYLESIGRIERVPGINTLRWRWTR